MPNQDNPWRAFSIEELWENMRSLYSNLREVIENTQFEGFEEARDRSTASWFDDDIGQSVRPWLLIPYRKTVDQESLHRFYDKAKSLIPHLDHCFDQKELTVQFLHSWGVFCQSAGYVNAVYMSVGDDLGHIRSGEVTKRKRSRHAQKKWLAHLILKLVDEENLSRPDAEDLVAGYVESILKNGVFADNFDRKWYDVILGKNGLASTYDENHFALKTMRKLAEEPTDDIPSIPIKIP